MLRLQALVRAIYPPQCLCCEALVQTEFGLCGPCWRDTPFVTGLVCDSCGTPLAGEESPSITVHCDDCLRNPPPWTQGRAVGVYAGRIRDMVLQLKHADRLDLAPALGDWLWQAAQPLLRPDMIATPIPLHWMRLLRRRYNQSALLSARLARRAALTHIPDLLQRHRHTPSQDHKTRAERFDNLTLALRINPRMTDKVRGRSVLLVDDVMTSGATLSAATYVLLEAGAADVSVAVIARVVPGLDRHTDGPLDRMAPFS